MQYESKCCHRQHNSFNVNHMSQFKVNIILFFIINHPKYNLSTGISDGSNFSYSYLLNLRPNIYKKNLNKQNGYF